MRVADFNYHLPPELIAQVPLPSRDQSRLLVVERPSATVHHSRFDQIRTWLRPDDLMVFNDSKVIPARLRARKPMTGGAIELLLLEELLPGRWRVLIRPAKRLKPGSPLVLGPGTHPLHATVLAKEPEGPAVVEFHGDVLGFAMQHGEMPLPPYIQRGHGHGYQEDPDRYQTVYARQQGSVAAPTAGLHFTTDLISKLRTEGIQMASLTLHVGAGTFLPVKSDSVESHRMHEERFSLPAETAAAINSAKADGRRVLAVGTTTARVLESVARGFLNGLWGEVPDPEAPHGFTPLQPIPHGRTRIFLHPPCRFRVMDGLVTNFHLPQSTLLMLVSAFMAPGHPDSGRIQTLDVYRKAVEQQYRFFSYGDAMLIT